MVRDILSKVIEKPIRSDKKVIIINDADKMTKEAQNCLLKTLEEPPEYICIILIAANESMLLNTIKSRCLKMNFSKIKDEQIKEYLNGKTEFKQMQENMIKMADGSIGKALTLNQDIEIYRGLEQFVESLKNESIIQLLQKKTEIFNKEKILNCLEYLQLLLLQFSFQEKKYLNCILYANESIQRLKINCNYDMVVDHLIFCAWKEFNK